jgi:hypothetical protein
MKTLAYAVSLAALLHLVPGCLDATADDGTTNDDELEVDDKGDAVTTPLVTDDNLNGLWTATVGGQKQTDDLVIESWSAIGIRLHVGARVYQLSRTGDQLTGTGVSLDVKPNKAGVKDDTFDGTIDGQTVHLSRDTTPKPPITLTFPADRPYRAWLADTIIPLAQQDRESYTATQSGPMLAFLTSCELYKHGSWLRQYFKGATFADQAKSFRDVVYAISNTTTTPRQITSNYKFSSTLQANLSDPSKIGLAMSTFGMYFTTAAGRALRMPMTPTSTAYFITDKPKRAALLGLVVMNTPTHGPLASTFGRQLLDLGAMPQTDNRTYVRGMMELLAKSDNKSVASLSGVGQSAMTDLFSVMAIEDYRGVAFGSPDLGWGYNMTNVQFFGMVSRALARPTTVDSTGKPVLGQVLVGGELRPWRGPQQRQRHAGVRGHGGAQDRRDELPAPGASGGGRRGRAGVRGRRPEERARLPRAAGHLPLHHRRALQLGHGEPQRRRGRRRDHRGGQLVRRAERRLGELRGVPAGARLHAEQRGGAEVDRLLI